MFPASLAFIAMLQAAPFPMVASGDEAPGGRMHIGDTGIRCVRQPCPSRGVFVPDARGLATREGLLMSDSDGKTPLPPMVAGAADRAAIERVWADGGCIAIEGRLIPGEDDRPALRVDRLIGACGAG